MSATRHVVIVLAVHRPDLNYLAQQIDSILMQDYRDFTLLLALDGDDSRVVGKLAQLSDPRSDIVIRKGRPGVRDTFFFGLERALSKHRSDRCYFAFCDQDDVWRQDKLTRLVSLMQSSGAQLCYSDASVVGPGNEPIGRSLYALEHRKSGGTLAELAIANHVSGMTMLFTARVARLALAWPPPVAEPAIFHDWWVALVAMSAGATAFDPEPLVSYRRHAGNVLGPRGPERSERKRRFLSPSYLDMCRNEFALRARIWGQLKRMTQAEGLPRPVETVDEAFTPVQLVKTMFANRGPLGRHAVRMLIGRWALLRTARRELDQTLEEASAKQLETASLNDLSEA